MTLTAMFDKYNLRAGQPIPVMSVYPLNEAADYLFRDYPLPAAISFPPTYYSAVDDNPAAPLLSAGLLNSYYTAACANYGTARVRALLHDGGSAWPLAAGSVATREHFEDIIWMLRTAEPYTVNSMPLVGDAVTPSYYLFRDTDPLPYPIRDAVPVARHPVHDRLTTQLWGRTYKDGTLTMEELLPYPSSTGSGSQEHCYTVGATHATAVGRYDEQYTAFLINDSKAPGSYAEAITESYGRSNTYYSRRYMGLVNVYIQMAAQVRPRPGYELSQYEVTWRLSIFTPVAEGCVFTTLVLDNGQTGTRFVRYYNNGATGDTWTVTVYNTNSVSLAGLDLDYTIAWPDGKTNIVTNVAPFTAAESRLGPFPSGAPSTTYYFNKLVRVTGLQYPS